MLLASMTAAFAEPVKVGFIYVGPIGDHGWTYRHDSGRQQVEEAFGDQVETMYLESVQYGPEAETAIRKMAQGGADIIFATSFGYMDPMLKVAKDFPDVKFEHATGYKQSDNMASYGLRLYQARHVQGVIAGMMTKTNKICYVGAYPIPEVIREINTFYMGQKMNPDVDIDIVWVNTWYDPVKEATAAKVMIADGCDMVAQHTDSPAPLQAAEKAGVLGFGQASNQYNLLQSTTDCYIDNWGPYYISKVQGVIDGTWETGDYFGHMNEDAVQMAPSLTCPLMSLLKHSV